MLDEILMALIAGGHALLVGVPGLAKTLMVRSLAEAVHLEFRRIQFTPDLVPSDITGTEILEEDSATGARSFRFVRGPIFANIVLADEINRAPPRTQAALLEAMQEHSVTASGETMRCPSRSSCSRRRIRSSRKARIRCPKRSSTASCSTFASAIRRRKRRSRFFAARRARSPSGLASSSVRRSSSRCSGSRATITAADSVLRYAASLVRATRPDDDARTRLVKRYVRWGAGPRAGQSLILGAKAHALLAGRLVVSPNDIKRVVASGASSSRAAELRRRGGRA